MALIYRAIFEVADPRGTFVERAPGLVQDWLRWKLGDNEFELPADDAPVLSEHGMELTSQTGSSGDCSVARVSAFEGSRDDGSQVKSTLTAIREPGRSWAWVDLERWTEGHGSSAWTPAPPRIVTTLLLHESASRGGLSLDPRAITAAGAEGELLVDLVLDAAREVPIVVVSYNKAEADGIKLAEERGRELAKRLAGVAVIYVLAEGAVQSFSKAMYDAVGADMDVHSGAVRTYLPRVGSISDYPGRHRFIAFPKLERRRPDLAALIVAPPLFRRAVESPPPPIWRESARAILLGAPSDQDLDELLDLAAKEIDELKATESDLEERLAAERVDNTDHQRRNDYLGRRLTFYRERLRALEPAMAAQEPDRDSFDPVFCFEVLEEARHRLTLVEIPKSVDEGVDALDAHADESWAPRAWSALQALQNYAEMKRDAQFNGSFKTYCDNSAGDFVIPATWVVPAETAQTLDNPRFREARTLPVASEVDESGRILMQEHIRIEKGGSPCPRIHYFDDTRGPTGRIHIGWFGDHLDSRAKS